MTVSTLYTLPSGELQAVRAAILIPPAHEPVTSCITGDNPLWEDRDDLVFSVSTR